ncbi:hypothetical protein BLAT2472_20321 [Burkholderia latens]
MVATVPFGARRAVCEIVVRRLAVRSPSGHRTVANRALPADAPGLAAGARYARCARAVCFGVNRAHATR